MLELFRFFKFNKSFGKIYAGADPELLEQCHKAKNLIRDYNQYDSDDLKFKENILQDLLGDKEQSLWIVTPFYVDYGNNIYFRNNCEVNMNCFLDDNKITIGDNTLISPNVNIYTAFHPTNVNELFVESKKDNSFEFCKA